MISAGFETTDPFTQTRFVVIQGAEETAGRGWVQGTAACRLGDAERRLAAGESIIMPRTSRTFTRGMSDQAR